MKTREIIKLLQENDPTGECNVCVDSGGAISHVVGLPGYYDGPYEYFEEENNNETFHISTEGRKILIRTMPLSDFAFDEDNQNNFVFHFKNQSKETAKERELEYKKEIDKWIKYRKELEIKTLPKIISDVMKKISEGWNIIQPANSTKIGHYNYMWWCKDLSKMKDITNIESEPVNNEHGNLRKLNQGECGAVLNYSLFEHIIKKNDYISYYVWKLRNSDQVKLHRELEKIKNE